MRARKRVSMEPCLNRYPESRAAWNRRGQEIHRNRVALQIHLEAELQVVPIPVLSVSVPSLKEPFRQGFVFLRRKPRRIEEDVHIGRAGMARGVLE